MKKSSSRHWSSMFIFAICASSLAVSLSAIPAMAGNADSLTDPALTARPASSAEAVILTKLAHVNVPITAIAICGPYAAVSYAGQYVGGEALFLEQNGQWQIKIKGGGWIIPEHYSKFLGNIPLRSAKSMNDLLQKEIEAERK